MTCLLLRSKQISLTVWSLPLPLLWQFVMDNGRKNKFLKQREWGSTLCSVLSMEWWDTFLLRKESGWKHGRRRKQWRSTANVDCKRKEEWFPVTHVGNGIMTPALMLYPKLGLQLIISGVVVIVTNNFSLHDSFLFLIIQCFVSISPLWICTWASMFTIINRVCFKPYVYQTLYACFMKFVSVLYLALG